MMRFLIKCHTYRMITNLIARITSDFKMDLPGNKEIKILQDMKNVIF